MPINPFLSFEAALPGIIAESPSQIFRVRETAADTFSEPTPYTAGPYTVRIEAWKAATAKDVWDEKGNTAVSLFMLLGHNLPKTVQEGGKTVPTFRVGDTIQDQDGNKYRVSSPPHWKGKVVQFTLTLQG